MNSRSAKARRLLILHVGLLTASILLTACEVLPLKTAPLSRPNPLSSPDISVSSFPTALGSPSPTTPASRPCPESGVIIAVGEVNAAMGLRAVSIEMVNCGTRPHSVNGYPALRVLDRDRRPIDVKVSDGSSSIATVDGYDIAPKKVTLKHGEMAAAGLLWRNTVTDSTVTATSGAYLEIAPADGESPQTVPLHMDLGNTGKLGVSAWGRPRRH